MDLFARLRERPSFASVTVSLFWQFFQKSQNSDRFEIDTVIGRAENAADGALKTVGVFQEYDFT